MMAQETRSKDPLHVRASHVSHIRVTLIRRMRAHRVPHLHGHTPLRQRILGSPKWGAAKPCFHAQNVPLL